MNDTLFLSLAELCNKLEKTTKRNEKTRLISTFLRKLNGEEIAPAVAQIIGRVFPEAEPKSLEVGYSTIMKVLERKKQATLFCS